MNIAIILAAGSGTRIKQSKIPKQFIEIDKKPIVIYTFEKFMNNENIDEIIIVCHPDWIEYLNQAMDRFKYSTNYTHITAGGLTRNDSIKMGLNYINKNLKIKSDDIVLTHDGARIFISSKTINENIEWAKKFGSVGTVVPSTDTIVCSLNGQKIDSIPNRNHLFNSQTPQSFSLEILNDIYHDNSSDTSDACTLAVKKGYDVYIVNGEHSNIKITTDFDIEILETMIRMNNL